MGSVCSGPSNKPKANAAVDNQNAPPAPATHNHTHGGEAAMEKHLVCGPNADQASTAASVYSPYDDTTRNKLLEMTADEFGIDLEPTLSAATPDAPEGCRYTLVTPEEHRNLHSVKFGYKTHHSDPRKHGNSLVQAHEVKGHYTDTGIFISYDMLDKIIKARQEDDQAAISAFAANTSAPMRAGGQQPVTQEVSQTVSEGVPGQGVGYMRFGSVL